MAEAADKNRAIHLAQNVTVLLLVLVAVVAFIGGWYLGTKHQSSSQKAASTSNLLSYKNTKYGFQLMYPSDWGNPSTTENTINNDTHYIVRFQKSPVNATSFNISLWMDYSDPKNSTCNASKQCFDPSAVTSVNIHDTLKNNKSVLTASDSSSYAIVSNPSGQNISSLTAAQIVNISKIKASAATITYQVSGVSGCSSNKFATNSTSGCITHSDYETVNQVLKSLKSL
jgi:hypothetical protein